MLSQTEYPDGSTGYVVVGRLDEEDWGQFLRSSGRFLTFNSSLGWDGTVGALPEIEGIGGRGLHFLPLESKFDVSQLNSLTGISYLYLGRGCEGNFDIRHFPDLQELRNFSDAKDLKTTLAGGNNLERLACIGAHLKDPRVLAELLSLKSLEVVRPTFDPAFIPEGIGIESVDFYSWTKLKDLNRLSTLPLRFLRLASCGRIANYSAISDMRKLESIFLDDCSPLPSAKLLTGLKMLKEIIFQGTEFLDKDISCLKGMDLETVALSGKGYRPCPEELTR